MTALHPRSLVPILTIALCASGLLAATPVSAQELKRGDRAEVTRKARLWIGKDKDPVQVAPGDVVKILKVRDKLARVERLSDGARGAIRVTYLKLIASGTGPAAAEPTPPEPPPPTEEGLPEGDPSIERGEPPLEPLEPPETVPEVIEPEPAMQPESEPAEPAADDTATPASQPTAEVSPPSEDVAVEAKAQCECDCPPAPECERCPEPEPPISGPQLAAMEFTTGVVASVASVPASLVLGTVIGSGPSNLFAAGIPALLVTALLPPLAVAGAEWLVASWLVGDPGSFWVAAGASGLVHVLAMVGGVVAGVSTDDLESTLGFTAVEAVLLPLATTGALLSTRPEDDGM